MIWLFFAVASRAIWAANNVIDKYVVERHIPNPSVYMLITATIGLFALIVAPFRGLSILPLPMLVVAFASGALYIYGILPYYKVLTFEEASRVVPVWNITPVFVLLLSALTLGEKLQPIHLLAFTLLVGGGF